MSEAGAAAGLQHGPVAGLGGGGGEAHDEPGAAGFRAVGPGGVEDVAVVERHLAGPQDQVHRLRLVHLDGHLVSIPQQMVLVAGDDVGEDGVAVGAGHHPHAAVLRRAVPERDPGRGVGRVVEARGRAVLVPGDDGRIAGGLGEHHRGLHQQLGPRTGSTASSTAGWVARSQAQRKPRWGRGMRRGSSTRRSSSSRLACRAATSAAVSTGTGNRTPSRR